ncbi:hypothetical protein FKM82_029692 [Ascaphus truei]
MGVPGCSFVVSSHPCLFLPQASKLREAAGFRGAGRQQTDPTAHCGGRTHGECADCSVVVTPFCVHRGVQLSTDNTASLFLSPRCLARSSL